MREPLGERRQLGSRRRQTRAERALDDPPQRAKRLADGGTLRLRRGDLHLQCRQLSRRLPVHCACCRESEAKVNRQLAERRDVDWLLDELRRAVTALLYRRSDHRADVDVVPRDDDWREMARRLLGRGERRLDLLDALVRQHVGRAERKELQETLVDEVLPDLVGELLVVAEAGGDVALMDVVRGAAAGNLVDLVKEGKALRPQLSDGLSVWLVPLSALHLPDLFAG